GSSNGSFQINLWVSDPPPGRDPEAEQRVRDFLSQWGPAVPAEAGGAGPLDFAAQSDALPPAGPQGVSSILGAFAPGVVAALKTRGLAYPMPCAFPSRAREETPENRGMPCLFLNTERGFGGKPPKNRGFVGILRGQKCLRRRFLRRSPVGQWSCGARSMPRVF